MLVHQFFHKYANTPLGERNTMLDFNQHGTHTLSTIYQRVKELEDKMRPDVIERDRLVRAAEEYWIRTGKI